YYQFALGKNFSPSKYQLLKNKFEIFLLSFIDTSNEAESETVSPFQLLSKQKLIAEIDAFLLANINETITLKQISEKLNISTSYLSSLYKKSHPQKSIIQTFNELKINKAKQYLEQSDLNITQISDILGFSSVHYFSRIFKKTVGISPVQYVHSLHTKK
ncbi:MAG: AraC family transcriptional regulator, partial [Oscillospiraceae bacterium]